MKRIHLIFSVERSGSTPIAQAIAFYLANVHSYSYLHEYFNPEAIGYTTINREILCDPRLWMNERQRSSLDHENILELRKKRLGDLAKSRGKYVLKIFPQQSNPWLLRNSAKVFVSRKNTFEHMLSFLVSTSSGQFYEPNGIRINKNSIYVPQELFIEFLLRIRAYRSLRKAYKESKELFYEDFVALGAAAIPKLLGWRAKPDWREFEGPKKQNTKPKLELFKNSKEIVDWYKKSELYNESFLP